MKTPLLSGREPDSAGYLTAAEILKGQLAGYPTDTYAHNGNKDLDRLQHEHPDWPIQLVANRRGSGSQRTGATGKAAWRVSSCYRHVYLATDR
jgi:hypothetical protein